MPFLLVVLTLISHLVILGGFTRLETEDMEVNVKRSLNELSNTLDWLNATAGDWAPWDDTYYFIQDAMQTIFKVIWGMLL